MPQLRRYFPDDFVGYYEPFLGGGAVFFETGHRATGRWVLADLNDELINVWTVVRDQASEFLRALEAYDGKHSEDAYYDIRDAEVPTDTVERAARFLYLNQTAWNGLWRVNRWGRFNVPWGARPFRGVAEDELRSVSELLADVDIRLADFRDVLSEPASGDFVYLDPPYLPVSDTSKFHGYTEKRFRRADLVELATLCRELTARGAHWVLSNRDTPLVRDLFHDAQIIALTTRRSVAAQNRRNVEPANSPEVIIVGRTG
jgi:DNA adenine methylase